ncbi:hypothetical protein DYH11_02430 [Candidatus Microgenomates bacterium CPR3]|nr:hypothetical protein [Candidatus Microgenomates bacterium CPR3]
MPTHSSFHLLCRRSINILVSSLLLFILFATNLLAPPKTHAATDPINATVSATARVPSASPTTGDTTAPPAVILISPHDGATTNQSRPELVWKTTFDSNSNNLSYTVFINGVATYLGVSNTGNSQQNNYISHLGDGNVYLTPTIDLAEGVYDWYVRATDASNNSSYSTTWRFTIDQTPPSLTVLNIDDLYESPPITEGAIFDLVGPQEVKIIFATEPYATVSVTITQSNGQTLSYSLPTSSSGLATLLVELPLGQNSLTTTSFDSAGLTTTLPSFILNLNTSSYPGIIDPGTLPIVRTLANIPSNLISLPATISQIKDENMIALIPHILLAIIIIILLIFIWHRRYNILIIDSSTSRPYRSVIVYHSRPTHSARVSDLASRIFVTSRAPIMYELGSTGRAYISNLERYSTLTIRTPDGLTHVLSISQSQRKYSIIF